MSVRYQRSLGEDLSRRPDPTTESDGSGEGRLVLVSLPHFFGGTRPGLTDTSRSESVREFRWGPTKIASTSLSLGSLKTRGLDISSSRTFWLGNPMKTAKKNTDFRNDSAEDSWTNFPYGQRSAYQDPYQCRPICHQIEILGAHP